MPPRLNVARAAQYAQVEPDFTAMMKQIWKNRWQVLNDEIKYQDPRFRKTTAQTNGPLMSRLKALCTSPGALDRELTRLRGLAYERFYIRQHNGAAWLTGLTRPIVMNDDRRLYQGPRYLVYIPEDFIIRGTDADFHFVPEGFEQATARHPHHTAKAKDNACDPLDYSPATCWGSFGTIASSCIKAGDLVDLYRNLYSYLTRVDQNSLLVISFSACYFLKDIGPAPVKAAADIPDAIRAPEYRRTYR